MNPFNGKQKVGSIGLPASETLAKIVDLDDGVTENAGPQARRVDH
jgi:hypothetical protein